MEEFSAKGLISKYFYDFSENLMKLIQENGAMTLQGFPGMIMAFCIVAEVTYIILDQLNGKAVMERILKLALYIGLTLMVFGKIGYSSLNLTAGLPATHQAKGKSDLLRDSHAFLRYYFDNIGSALTGDAKESNEETSIINSVRKNGVVRQLCDTDAGGDAGKMACMKKYTDKTYKDVQLEFEEKYKCTGMLSSLGTACAFPQYFTMESIFVIMVGILYIFRFIGFVVILFGYILTVVMTYMMLKLLFPFIIYEKTRDEMWRSIKFFFSTTSIVALLGFLEYVFNLAIGSLMMTTGNATNWVEFGIYFYLSAVLTIIIFGVEIALYFKVPEISKKLWDLNIGALVNISEYAQDGLKMGMQLLGLGTQVASLGVVTSMAKTLGLSRFMSNAKSAAGGAAGDMMGGDGDGGPTGGGGGGGSSPKSNLSRELNPSMGDYPGRDASTQGFYGPRDGGTSTSRPAPESQVNPADFERMKPKKPSQGSDDDAPESNGPTPSQSKLNDTGSGQSQSSAKSGSQASSGAPKSDVDPGMLSRLGRGVKSGLTSAKDSIADKATSAKDSVVGKASQIKNMSKNDWMQAGKGAAVAGAKGLGNIAKESAKGLGHIAVDGTRMALHSAAGESRVGFDHGVKPIEKTKTKLHDVKEDILDANTDKKWLKKGVKENDLYTPEHGAKDLLTDNSAYLKMGNAIKADERKLGDLRSELQRAESSVLNGTGSFEETTKLRERVAEIEKGIENKKLERKKLSEEYDLAKAEIMHKLMEGTLDTEEQERMINLLGNPDAFTSDEMKAIMADPEAKGFVQFAEMKRQTDRNIERIRSKVESELSKNGMISASTESELKDMHNVIPNSVMQELVKQIKERTTVNYEKMAKERDEKKKREREARNKKK